MCLGCNLPSIITVIFLLIVKPTLINMIGACPTPLPCYCMGSDLMVCAFKRLEALPYFLDFTEVWQCLDLSENFLHELPAMGFNGVKVKNLTLTRNTIKTVHPQALAGIFHLEILDMSHNFITSLPREVFSSLRDLQILNLRYNRFKSLPPELLRDLTNLKKLDLSGNSFSSIPSSALRSAHNLRQLIIRKNKLKSVAPYAFGGLSLEVLDIGANTSPLVLKEGSFCGLEPRIIHSEPGVVEWAGLQTLVLDHNAMSSLDPCITKLIWTLTSVRLSGNPLRCDCRIFLFRDAAAQMKLPLAQCAYPGKFAGKFVGDIEEGRYHCLWNETRPHCDRLCENVPQVLQNLSNQQKISIPLSIAIMLVLCMLDMTDL